MSMPPMRVDNEPVELEDVECLKDTGKALLCLIGKREVWVPQSQVHDDSEVYAKGHKGQLVIMSWFAEQEGLA